MVLRVVLMISLFLGTVSRVADADTLPNPSASDRLPNVVFLSPDTSRFWHMVAGFMEQVAADLEVEFDVLFDEGRHRLSYLKLVQQVLSREEKPDYLIIMWKEQVTAQILDYARRQSVKVFSFNTAVPEAAREKVGRNISKSVCGKAGKRFINRGNWVSKSVYFGPSLQILPSAYAPR